jgi:integrase
MGEVGRGRMDEGRRHYGGPYLPGDQQGRARLGRRDVTQGAMDVARSAARRAGIENLAPHDLCRTCARLCHLAGGELEQIQFLLGHVFVQTTERYLGCKQKLRCAVNDRLGIEPDAAA